MANKWVHQYSSGQTFADFAFPEDEDPCTWFAPSTSGTVVITQVGGTNLTYVAVGGEVVRGRFTKLVSNSCTKLTCGNQEPPSPALATAGTSTAASLDTRISTDESTATSLTSRVSVEESTRTSADSSVVTRFSTSVSTLTSTDTSIVTRFSTSVSTLTSADTSLTTRISVAESVEASKG